MLKRTFFAFIAMIFLTSLSHAQGHRDRFKVLIQQKDVKGQHELLKKWEAADPNDPELYVSFFNHYILKARQETITLTPTKPSKGESVAMTKDDDKTVAYLGSNVSYSKAEFDLAIMYIDKGIAKFPNRLDMRFGKTYALGQIEDYERFKDEIIRAVEYFGANKTQWTWADNKPVENPRDFMLRSMQDYVVQLFNAGDSEAKLIQPISEAVLKYYPEHIESLSNLAVVNMINGNLDGALVSLLKAEKIVPDDPVVIGNIGFCYFKKRNIRDATKYYERLAKIGDENAKNDANSKLAEMKTWK